MEIYTSPEKYIEKILKESLAGVGFSLEKYNGLVEIKDKTNPIFGDYSTNLPFVLSKEKNPFGETSEEIAKKIRDIIEKKGDEFLEKIEIAGGGFLNFFLKTDFFRKKYFEFDKRIDEINKMGKGNPIIIEFFSPNVAKPMHIGHLRNAIIGDFLANLFETFGYKVTRWNHIGDWGTQFGKLIVAYKKWGDKENIDKEPIKEILSLYVKFHKEAEENPELEDEARKEFKKMEDGDRENLDLLEWFSKESLKEFDKISQKIISREFDVIRGESAYIKDNHEIIEELKNKRITKESEGALVIDLGENIPPALIQKNDGATLYFTREISSLKYRIEKYNPKEILYVVADEQSLHFQQLEKVVGILNERKFSGFEDMPKIKHIKYGLVCGKDGKKLSTREGTSLPAESFINDVENEAGKVVDGKRADLKEDERKEISQKIAISALKYSFLKDRKESNVIFDPQKSLSFNGNNSPYLQYTHVRIKKILDEFKDFKFDLKNLDSVEEDNRLIIKKIWEFNSVLEDSTKNYSSNNLTDYVFELCNKINSFYESTPILKDDNKERKLAHIGILSEAKKTLEKSFEIIGIKKLSKI